MITRDAIIQNFKKLAESVKNLGFPMVCFCCEQKIPKGYLCPECLRKINFIPPPLCRLCSRPAGKNKTTDCPRCLKRKDRPFYERVICTAYYSPPLSNLIELFKYKNYDYLGEFLGSLMKQHLDTIGFSLSGYDCLTCVPLHRIKEKERGYNQTELLGKILAKHFEIPFKNDIISKIRYNESQTKVAREARAINIKGSFMANENASGKKIILVDDVFTTGSTAKECSRALMEKGARGITVLALAKG